MARYKLVKSLNMELIGVVINDDTHLTYPKGIYIFIDTNDNDWNEYLIWAETNTADASNIIIDYMAIVYSEQFKRTIVCNWIEEPDAPLTAEEKILWQNYRKEIKEIMRSRAIPINKQMYESITWPIAP